MEMSNTKVSILIPLFNAEKFIAETLECCLNQTYYNIEVIVVDDGSTDKSLSIAQEYESRDSRIHVYHQENAGGCRARNFAFEKSTGDYIMYLDADDLMSSNKVEAQIKLLAAEDNPFVVAICPWQEFFESIEISFDNRPCYRDYEDPIQLLTDIWNKNTMMAVTCYMTSRLLIEKTGMWDESLTKNQDGEFFCRILCNASRIVFCKDARFFYRRGHVSVSTSGRLTPTKIQSSLDSRISYEKNVLAKRDTKEIRIGLIKNYSLVMLNSPINSIWYRSARLRINKLGGRPIHPSAQGLKAFFINLIGFETFLLIKDKLHKN